MNIKLALSVAGVGAALLSGGCSGTGAAFSAANIGLNMAKNDSHLRIWLDSQKAEQNTLKKAATGYSEWKIKEQVSSSPQLQFEIQQPEKFGRITMVTVSIYQQHEADYSHQAEYTIVARDTNNPQAQMRPGTTYNLGSPGEGFRIMNLTGQDVSSVALTPGLKYKLVLTVKADRSETAQVEFKAK